MVKDKGTISFFGTWLSSFPNTIYWRDYPFPEADTICFLLFLKKYSNWYLDLKT